MSVYNFNDNEHATVNSHRTGQSGSNGIQPTGYHQIEKHNQSESSVQLTRLMSKTALLVRQRRAMLEQLSCSICKGYLIDATTIVECMDSFCKSCIVKYLRINNDCPKCGVIVSGRNPSEVLRADRVLQEIVYKLIPGLFDDEMRRRREFYKQYYGAISSTSSEEDDESSTGPLTINGSSLAGEKYGVISHPKPFYKPSDSIDLSIEPQTRGENSTIYYDDKRQSIVTCFTGHLQRDIHDDGYSFSAVDSQLFKTYLRCPAGLTILQLKKFISAKFNICPVDIIHLKYLNESLRDEYSLMDIVYIYDWRSIEHIPLFFIIERDLSKVSMLNGHSDTNRHSGKSTRHSVGTSTQTVKRVCIDPQPKFYYEKNNNEVDLVNTEGRSMRPRVEKPANISKTTHVVQTNPIIKASRDNDNRSQFNGVITREQSSRHNGLSGTCPSKKTTTFGRSGEPSSRIQATSSSRAYTTSYDPKVNINISVANQSQNDASNHSSNRTTQKSDNHIPQSRTTSQIVPFTGSNYTTLSSSSPCSLVTMESFVESRNVVTALSSSPSVASPFMNSFTGASGSRNRDEQAPSYDSTPKLAFTIVTERGVTIVRHNQVNNQHETSLPKSDAARKNLIARSMEIGVSRNRFDSEPSTRAVTSHSDSQPSSSRFASDDTVSPRHQIKVKPIYKTLVDPTKLKTPNLKKFGSTARH